MSQNECLIHWTLSWPFHQWRSYRRKQGVVPPNCQQNHSGQHTYVDTPEHCHCFSVGKCEMTLRWHAAMPEIFTAVPPIAMPLLIILFQTNKGEGCTHTFFITVKDQPWRGMKTLHHSKKDSSLGSFMSLRLYSLLLAVKDCGYWQILIFSLKFGRILWSIWASASFMYHIKVVNTYCSIRKQSWMQAREAGSYIIWRANDIWNSICY